MKPSFIRVWFLAVLAAIMLLTAHAALAAPTCQDRRGLTVRCETSGAMPVGWSLPPEERKLRPPAPTVSQLLHLVCTLGLLFALIALLPDFDGSRGRDWDKQEDDD